MPRAGGQPVTTCSFCKEEIRDDAIKCRHCQSILIPIPAPTPVPDAPPDRVTYVLDRDLVRFAKFSTSVLSVIIVVGLLLYGVDLKDMRKEMNDTQKEIDTKAGEVRTSLDQVIALRAQMQTMVLDIEAFRKSAAAGANDIAETVRKAGIVADQLASRVTNSNVSADAGGAKTAARRLSTSEVLTLVSRDIEKARQFFASLGLEPPPIKAAIHPDPELANAYWDRNTVLFGMGMVNSDVFGPYDPKIVYHEVCHSLFDLRFIGQSGSVAESICDVLAVLVENSDWTIGLIRTGDPAKPAHLRSLKDPGNAYDLPSLGKDPQVAHMSQYVTMRADNGGVHINLGIVNKAAYLMSEGGTFRGVTVGPGIGRQKLGRLYAATLRRLPSGVDFQLFRSELVATAGLLFGKDSADVKTVAEAFRAVGIE